MIFLVVRSAGQVPILCVGELLVERESDRTETVIGRRLDAVLNQPGALAALAEAVIAYDPVWAIGTGRTATPAHAQDMHAFIRTRIAAHDPALAERMRIVYGGSVKANNAAELIAMDENDSDQI